MSKNQPDLRYDIIIVGAGISGLFIAWRLLEKDQGLKILIIEKLEWVGGRLQTTTVPIKYAGDGKTYLVKDEEGGMRFNSGMPHICQLVATLGLESVPFKMTYNGTNRCYFRGKAFTIAETPRIWDLLYRLDDEESNQSPGTVILGIVKKILAQNKYKFTGEEGLPSTPEEWQTFRNKCKFNGYYLNQWGFWALMRAAGLSEECINWLENAIGFMGPTQSCINAGESLQILCDFPNDPDFNTLKDGFQSIPDKIADIIKDKVRFKLNESVVAISEVDEALQVATDKQVYTGKKVVLAIPAKGLEGIIQHSALLQKGSQDFHKAVDSVQNMELTKIGLYFNERWWHKTPVNLTCGPSFNDLPLGTVYCFSQYPENDVDDQNYFGPAALTIYNDYDRGSFWKEMQNLGEPYRGTVPQPANTDPASTLLVAEALRQIKLLLGLKETDEVPAPVLSTFRIWGEGKFGYGYHQYKLNVNDTTDVYPHIWNPHPNVFICNEAWSPEQGWIEGALIASDYVLTKGFKLQPFLDKKTKTQNNAGENNKRKFTQANFT